MTENGKISLCENLLQCGTLLKSPSTCMLHVSIIVGSGGVLLCRLRRGAQQVRSAHVNSATLVLASKWRNHFGGWLTSALSLCCRTSWTSGSMTIMQVYLDTGRASPCWNFSANQVYVAAVSSDHKQQSACN